MSRFLPPAEFTAGASELQLLLLRFEPITEDTYIAANMVGESSY
ncbi:hypothetical protein [Methylobacterium nigriterrae]